MGSPSRFRILWAPVAIRDIEEIAAYLIASDCHEAAQRFAERIRQKAASLERFPRRGRRVAEVVRFGLHAWRELVVSPYRLIYRIGGKQVEVVVVFDGRRDLEELLLERIIRHQEAEHEQ